MKILICGASMGIGGAETHMLQLARGLAAKGHEVTVAARRGALCRELCERGDIRFMDMPLDGLGRATFCYFKLLRIIKRENFDIVHAHSRIAALMVSVIKRTNKNLRFGFAVTAHARYKRDVLKDMLSSWGDECIAVSEDIRAHLTTGFGVERENITVIPNGIDTEKFSSESVARGKSRLLFASRLDKDCSLGAELLCRIAARLCEEESNISITVAGGGNDLERIRRLANEANRMIGRECVKVVGECTDMRNLIERTDCAVGVSRFALEAMSMKRTAVIFGNEGALGLFDGRRMHEAVESNFTARGCGDTNEEFLLAEILRLMRMSDDERERLCVFGRNVVLARYSGDASVRMTLRVYERLLPTKPVITVGGYYGFGNIGDETVCAELVKGLERELPRAEIRILSKNAKKAESENTKGVDRNSPRAVFRTLGESDVYICGGGSLLQNSTSLRSLAYYCGLMSLARLRGCKCIIAANGIGPLRGRTAKAMARAALCKADYVSVRDEESQREVERLTGGRVKCYLGADAALSADTGAPSFGGKYAAVALRGREERMCATALGIGEFCSEKRLVPLFVTMDVKQDIADAALFAGLTCGEYLAAWEIRDVLGALEKSAVAIGSRLHFLIFALHKGVPFAAFGDDPKIVAFSLMTLGREPISLKRTASKGSGEVREELEAYIECCKEFYKTGGRERVLARCGELYKNDILRIADICKNLP